MNLSPLAQAINELYDGDFDDWIIIGDDDVENIQWVDTPSGSIPSSDQLITRRDELRSDRPTNKLRAKRNKLLQETDWWELPSQAPMSAERETYRQALRDITDTYTSLDDVIWPTKPE